MSLNVRSVAVVGSGVIGASWAYLFLTKGLRVVMSDPAKGAEESFRQFVTTANIGSNGSAGDLQNLLDRFEFVDDIRPHLPKVDFVQENGPERLELKQRIVASIDEHTRPEVVIALSSSGLPPLEFITEYKKAPGYILVGYLFNPPYLIPLVEVIPHPGTNQASITAAIEFYKSLAAINNEVYNLISRGIVLARDLDAAILLGPGLRWAFTGPVVINTLGGGGGPDAIRGWEQDILRNRFAWGETDVAKLRDEVKKSYGNTNWAEIIRERDSVLMDLLAAKSKAPSLD